MLRKPELYNQVVSLRKEGFSYTEILSKAPIGYGTISRWCQHIKLTPEQKRRLYEKKTNTPLIANQKMRAALSREQASVWATEKSKHLKSISNEEREILLGIALYWAEGTKIVERKRTEIGFTNTDPIMIRSMMSFLRTVLLVPENKYRIVVRIGDKGNVVAAQNFWSTTTRIPLSQFGKPELLRLNENSKSLTKYPSGMCRIVVHNASAARKIAALLVTLQELLTKE